MKKLLLISVLLTSMCTALLAQTNLREGIVITLQGDTLHGSIEYRTERINAERCVFLPDGSNEYTTYLPGEIQGYRYLDNGIYYVTRRIPVRDIYMNEVPKLQFVQYVMRGKMSLLYAESEKIQILETDDGKSASFREFDSDRQHTAKERGEQLRAVSELLQPSYKAASMLWSKDNSLKNTKQVVATYNDDVCHDGVCEVFEYKNKKTPKADHSVQFVVKVGVNVGKLITNYAAPSKDLGQFTNPSLTVGADFSMERLHKGFFIQTALGYSYLKASGENIEKTYYGRRKTHGYETTANMITLQLGLAYQFQIGDFKPFVRAGYDLQGLFGDQIADDIYTPGPEKSHFSLATTVKSDHNYDLGPAGYYAGIGLEYPLKTGALVFDCSFVSNVKSDFMTRSYSLNTNYLSCNLGYKF